MAPRHRSQSASISAWTSAADSNLAERIAEQLGLPFGVKRSNLPQTTKIDLPGREIHDRTGVSAARVLVH